MLCGEWALKTWYCTQCNAICNHSMLSLMSLKEIMEDDGFVDFCWYLGRLVKVLCANMEGGDSEYLVKKNILPNCLYSSNAILRRHTKTFSEFQWGELAYVHTEWLAGSASLQWLVCWPCLLSDKDSCSLNNPWVTTGFTDLANLSWTIERHGKSKNHINSHLTNRIF